MASFGKEIKLFFFFKKNVFLKGKGHTMDFEETRLFL